MNNTLYLQQMETSLVSMAKAIASAAALTGEARRDVLTHAELRREMASVFALASIAESLTLIAGRSDSLAGIEEMLNDIAGTLVQSDMMSPDGGEMS